MNGGGLQLLPEARRKLEIKTPGANKIVFVSVMILVLVGIIFGATFFYKSSLESKLTDLDTSLAGINSRRQAEKESKILTLEKQTATLGSILKEHNFWSEGFLKIEERVLPNVVLEMFNGSISDNTVSFKATTTDFATIARQAASFAQEGSVKDIQINRAVALPNNLVEFYLKLIFDKDKFLGKTEVTE